MDKKIENRVREHMEIPDTIPTQWGVVIENNRGEQSYRPALMFSCDGHTAFVDVLRDEIRTPREVKGISDKVLPADVIVDGDLLMLDTHKGGYKTTLTLQRLETLYFNKVFNEHLRKHIASGKVVI